MKSINIRIKKLPHAPAGLTDYATPGAACVDLRAALAEPLTVQPLQRVLVPTGFEIEIPEGYECQVRARSGLSIKHGMTLINGVGTIDSDYRDELKVPMVNLSNEAFTIQPGDRIAQMLAAPVTKINWEESLELASVGGRTGGFGSTGKA